MLEGFQKVFSDDGFATQSLSSKDLTFFREIVVKHYQSILKDIGGINDPALLNVPINKYHEISDHVDHANLWSKNNRILPETDYARMMKTDFFQALQNEIGDVLISDEENIGYPEVYWRLVRPPPHKDIGPLHADAWFWKLGHGDMPFGFQRVKFWFSLWNESGENGFRYVTGSHQQDHPYKGEMRNGFIKPVFDEKDHDFDISLFNSSPGDYIIFNDKLLHGGFVGGHETRVSFEFTLFLPNTYVHDKLGVSTPSNKAVA